MDTTSPLLDLPPELRNIVFNHLFAMIAEDRAATVCAAYAAEPKDVFTVLRLPTSPPPQQPGITRTCRQSRRETLLSHYTSGPSFCVVNELHIGIKDPILSEWMSSIKEHSPNIKQLTVRFRGRRNIVSWSAIDLSGWPTVSVKVCSKSRNAYPFSHPHDTEPCKGCSGHTNYENYESSQVKSSSASSFWEHMYRFSNESFIIAADIWGYYGAKMGRNGV